MERVTLKRLEDPDGVPFWYVVRARVVSVSGEQHACKRRALNTYDDNDDKENTRPWMIVNGKLLPPVPVFASSS